MLWRSLAISEARLWTSLTVTGTTACLPEPRHAVDALNTAEVMFPRETLILERSADLDVDVEILVDSHTMGFMLGETQVPSCFTNTHFLYLSCLLASHAFHIASFLASTRDFRFIVWLWHGVSLDRHAAFEEIGVIMLGRQHCVRFIL